MPSLGPPAHMPSNLTSFEQAFLQDLAANKQAWVEAARIALEGTGSLACSERASTWTKVAAALPDAESRAALVFAIDELLSGICHSFLATLDGATQLAEETLLEVKGSDSVPFKRHLHEFWPQEPSSEA
jgi:hypothetical protein